MRTPKEPEKNDEPKLTVTSAEILGKCIVQIQQLEEREQERVVHSLCAFFSVWAPEKTGERREDE